jgi:hypothetical protein
MQLYVPHTYPEQRKVPVFRMPLIQTLLCRNDAALALQNIRFHLETGVDHVVVTDHLSTDGLRDLLTPFIDQRVLTYIHQTSPGFDQSKWVTHMADIAYKTLKARWVINTDTDEFWVTISGKSLKTAVQIRPLTNILRAKRHDFISPKEGSKSFWQDMVYRKAKSTNSMGINLPDKIAHRCAPNLTIHAGNHDISGYRRKRVRSNILEVLHFPIRNAAQFKQKIAIGGQALSLTPEIKPGIGQTWRKQFIELNETGELRYITENILTQAQIKSGLDDGTLITDTRLRDKMRLLGIK